MSRSWYQYNGGNEAVVGNYSQLSFPFGLCIGGSSLCAIYAYGTGTNPTTISTNLISYFTPAKASASPAGYPATGQPYVYTVQ